MIIRQALISAIKKLRQANIQMAQLDAEILLAFILNKSKGYLLANPEKKISSSQLKRYQKQISHRVNKIPVAYLTCHKEFYNLDFQVNRHVLIPRPETETLIETTISQVRQKKISGQSKIRLADIGTGSGCIVITLAHYLPDVQFYASDISPKALSQARSNAQKFKVLKKIKFLQGDILKPYKKTGQFDIIVANLPYLLPKNAKQLKHEPEIALNGGKLGLILIENLIEQSGVHLKLDGLILLEIAPTQTKAVSYFVEKYLPNKTVKFIKDLAGRERVALIK